MKESVISLEGPLDVTSQPFIVRRNEIPVSTAAIDASLEARPLLGHPLLHLALSSSGAALSWLRVEPGQTIAPLSHPTPALLVVVQGQAELIGATHQGIEKGDMITVPAGEEYGFREVGKTGLDLLRVTFSFKEREGDVTTLDELLKLNEARVTRILETPYFRMLKTRGLDTKAKRDRFRECIRLFSDFFQRFLFTRQALCKEAEYSAKFAEHLSEEFGHNKLLRDVNNPRVYGDPVLQATLGWFCQQMLTLDNAGKMVVNVVLETAGYHFHTLATPIFAGDEGAQYFGTHAEADEHHKDFGIDVLEGYSPKVYRDLAKTLETAWDMLEAVTQRIYELVMQAETSS